MDSFEAKTDNFERIHSSERIQFEFQSMFNVISIFQVQITNECDTREPILIRKTACISLVQANKQNFPIRVNSAYTDIVF